MSDTRKIRVKKELPSEKPKPHSVATVGVDPAVPEGDRTVQINIAAEQAPVASGVSAVASAMRGMFDGAGYRFAIHYDRDFSTLQDIVVLVIHKNGNREYNVESRVPREALMGMRTPFDRDRVVAGVVYDLMDGLSDFFRREIASSLVSSSATRDMMENWMGRGRG